MKFRVWGSRRRPDARCRSDDSERSTPAAAASERMQLECTSGPLAGHTVERSNGSSWWAAEDGTVYTTKSITVSGDEGVVFRTTTAGRRRSLRYARARTSSGRGTWNSCERTGDAEPPGVDQLGEMDAR